MPGLDQSKHGRFWIWVRSCCVQTGREKKSGPGFSPASLVGVLSLACSAARISLSICPPMKRARIGTVDSIQVSVLPLSLVTMLHTTTPPRFLFSTIGLLFWRTCPLKADLNLQFNGVKRFPYEDSIHYTAHPRSRAHSRGSTWRS